MLKLLKPANPEDLFVQRYDLLIGWALSLTAHNHALAEDLVHDAFIQFTLRRAELGAIENTDAYLHRMLRNMHLSQVRRACLIQNSRFSIANFDSAEMGLRAVDPREDVTVQDELRLICQYACARKETSKAGSVLILRFFHSYYPSEIARVLRTTRTAVDRWLALARREAKTYLVDPTAVRFAGGFTTENPPSTAGELGYARTTVELLNELRKTIFDSRKSDCFSLTQLKDLYRAKTTVDSTMLSHIVSCPNCLNAVNRLLGLPLLGERNSDDRLGRDRDVPPDSSGGGEAGGGGSLVESKTRYQRRLKEVIEHRPQELRIAVNGFVLGAQQVSSEFNKQALTVNVDEPIGFIEVFSEQGVRLLFFDVDQPINGNIEQRASAEFDSGRKLELSLNFRGPWPALNVAYRDPTFEAVAAVDSLESEVEGPAEVQRPTSNAQGQFANVCGLWAKVRSQLPNVGHWTFDFGLLLRPATVTALLGVLLIVAFIAIGLRTPVTPVTAAQLLDQAAQQEEKLAARTDQVLHRTINLEERRVGQTSSLSGGGDLIARRRIEIWQSAERGITARRLYNEDGVLVAGDWRRSDGVQTLYHHGARPQLQPAPDKRGGKSATLSFDNVWQLSPSAKEFTSLVARDAAKFQETATSYVINYEGGDHVSGVAGQELVEATLTLSRADLHATEMTVVVRDDDANPQSAINRGPRTGSPAGVVDNPQFRVYRFLETSFERRPAGAVEPKVFEPDAELLVSTAATSTVVNKSSRGPEPQPVPGPEPATRDLEVEVLRLLSEARADLGEQVSLTRTAEGKLLVQGIVETGERKTELLRALKPVSSNPSLKVEISSVSEALGRQKSPASSSTIVKQVEVAEGSTIPVYRDLREYFSSKGISNDRIDEETRQYSNRMLSRSRQALRHAWALRRLGERFTPEDLKTLSAEARAKRLAMIREHTQAFQQETEKLRLGLLPIFFRSAVRREPKDMEINNDSDLIRALARLAEMASTNDEAIRSAFTISAGSATFSVIKTPEFSQSLRSAEKLAAKIRAQAQKSSQEIPGNRH